MRDGRASQNMTESKIRGRCGEWPGERPHATCTLTTGGGERRVSYIILYPMRMAVWP